MGGHLPDLLVGILADVFWRVDREQLVGVHSHQDGACVGLWATRNRELIPSYVGALILESSQALPYSIPLEGRALALVLESHLPMSWGGGGVAVCRQRASG